MPRVGPPSPNRPCSLMYRQHMSFRRTRRTQVRDLFLDEVFWRQTQPIFVFMYFNYREREH